MKNIYSYIFSSLPKKLIASTFVLMAIILPISSINAAAIKLESSIGVANVTNGDTQYAHSVNAKYDQVVKFQVFYHNTENADSGKIAENVKVKIAIPNQPGTVQTVRSTVSGDNTNTVESSATVNLDDAKANIEYIPGSAVWRHNVGTNDKINYQETKISDAVVTSGQGLVLENEKPCYNFAATVTVLARVKVAGISVDKEVRVKGTTAWTTNNTANPGDTLEYMITYKNMGNTWQNNVVIRDNLPPKLTYIDGSAIFYNATYPGGKSATDDVTKGGLIVGNYGPGANAYVKFEVKIPDASGLNCGNTEFRNVGIAKPEGMNEFYNTAITTVNKPCTPVTPLYSCDSLTVESYDDLSIKATVKYTAKNGATFKTANYNFGDGSAELITDKTTVNYTYSQDGQYTVRANLTFMVDGKAQVVSSPACAQTVTFNHNKPVPPPSPPAPPTPGVIPNTGPGEVVAGVFVATTIAGSIGYRIWAARRFDR